MHSDDPRPTAYALGELDPAERDAFESALAADPELQAEVQSVAALADELARLPAAKADRLTAKQRAHLAAACSVGLRPSHSSRRADVRQVTAILALAACVVFALVLTLRPPTSSPTPTGQLAAITPAAPESFQASPFATPIELSLRDRLAVERKLVEAQNFLARGSYDLARKRSEQVLDVDGVNPTARRLIAQVDEAKAAYAARSQQPKTLEAAIAQAPKVAANLGREIVHRHSGEAAPAAEIVTYSPPQQVSAEPAAPRAKEYRFVPAEPGDSRDQSPLLGDIPLLGRFIPVDDLGTPAGKAASTETYAPITANVFQAPTDQPLSTFSIDVDTASYANVRRFLQAGQRPPADAVRLEELINYFPSALPAPTDGAPFSITTDVTRAPWAEDRLLARVALKGRELAAEAVPPSNLVFLIDVSGSMNEPNKLPLLQRSLRALVERLRPEDRVAIATYAGRSGLALESTPAREKTRILAAIDALTPGGSTNGASGITLAYQTAREHFLRDGNNRVILCTDGDFNVGVTSRDELTALIERERRSGVFLSVLGFGTGNLKDATMELLANKGNGNYAYIDSVAEGRKVLVEEMGGTLFTIAKDVKIQVEFNPTTVAGYRLLGYENRLLAKEDFNDDTKDAGEIGAGHSVTALYELIPAGQPLPNDRRVDPLKYQANPEADVRKSKIENRKSEDLFTVKLRFKAPDGDRSELLERVVGPSVTPFAEASADFRFAAAVAAFGMNLRAGTGDPATEWNAVQRIARDAMGDDPGAYRAEFLTLIEKAKNL